MGSTTRGNYSGCKVTKIVVHKPPIQSYKSPQYSGTQAPNTVVHKPPNTVVHSCTQSQILPYTVVHQPPIPGQIPPYLSCVADCLFNIVVNQGNIEKDYEYSRVLLYETLPARFIHKVKYEYKRSILSKPSAYTMWTVDSTHWTENCVQYIVGHYLEKPRG